MTVYRITIANITTAELAAAGQDAGLNGSVFASAGFGSWGLEPGATAELAGLPAETVESFARDVLTARGESAAYITADGNTARLLWADGRPDDVL